MNSVLFICGIALCVAGTLPIAQWTIQGWKSARESQRHLEDLREIIQKKIGQSQKRKSPAVGAEGNWNGFRLFEVDRLNRETPTCTSVYLKPVDGRPIADFKPGQHLTLKLNIPGQPKPVIRCYSLSDAPGKQYYRITVKRASHPPNRPELKPGKASSFINEGLKEGDQIEIKAPAGHFFLQDDPYRPAVLLAGGIGITPMVSMANTLLENNSKRPIILLYGVRNGLDQPFRHHLEELGSRHDNFFSIFCYSRPCPEDLLDRDYHIEGFVSVDILKKLLPQPACEFYLCGPPKFMDSIYNDLKDWNVGEDQIFFEAFGPATVGKNRNKEKGSHLTEMTHQIRFSQSEVTVKWDGSCDSLLELAEAKEIPIDSGCRAGSCGTCVTKILSGSVSYPDNQAVDCGSDECLACIAQPASDLELEV